MPSSRNKGRFKLLHKLRALTGTLELNGPPADWDTVPAKRIQESFAGGSEGLFVEALKNEDIGEPYFNAIDWGRRKGFKTVDVYYPIDSIDRTKEYRTIGLWAMQWYLYYNPETGSHPWVHTCTGHGLLDILDHVKSRLEGCYDNPNFAVNNCYVFGARHFNEYKMVGQMMVAYTGTGDFGHQVLSTSPVAPKKHIDRGHMIVADHHRPLKDYPTFEIGFCFSLLESWHPWALLESIRKQCQYGAYFVMRKGRFDRDTGAQPIYPKFLNPNADYTIESVQEFIDEIQPGAGTRVVDISMRNKREYHFYVEFDHENYPDWKYIEDWGDDPLGVN